jgi:hypothetical protein
MVVQDVSKTIDTNITNHHKSSNIVSEKWIVTNQHVFTVVITVTMQHHEMQVKIITVKS